MIRCPIFIYENGDVISHESIEAAETFLEPIDVQDGENVVFDASGRILQLSVESTLFSVDRVRIREPQKSVRDEDQFRRALITFLANVNQITDGALNLQNDGALETMATERLVSLTVEYSAS